MLFRRLKEKATVENHPKIYIIIVQDNLKIHRRYIRGQFLVQVCPILIKETFQDLQILRRVPIFWLSSMTEIEEPLFFPASANQIQRLITMLTYTNQITT